jgi:GNAT superfamily N-acetyltransferase
LTTPLFRTAGPHDADPIARLHADSWRRHYRGAFSDAFLDGDILTDRSTVWTTRLTNPAHHTTVVAEDALGLAGFIHVIFDHDPRWGSFVDNLHVTHDRHRTGIGTALLTHAARAATDHAASRSLYLWVLTQNTAAQRFYRAAGGTPTETATVEPPGGVPGRLHGTPTKIRYTWPDTTALQPTGPIAGHRLDSRA